MIIHSKAPYRVSFFGGGTDYPPYYLKHGGGVISTAINKYIHVFLKPSTVFSRAKYIIKYSEIEMVDGVSAIRHPVVRAVFSHFCVNEGVELNIMSDIPAGSGLGSSSVFTVALIGAVLRLKGLHYNKVEVARIAMMVEQELLHEKVGSQDQYAAAIGGFNHIKFHTTGLIEHTPIYLPQVKLRSFFEKFFLVYTNVTRKNDTVTVEQDQKLKKGELVEYLLEMKKITQRAKELIIEDRFCDFGKLLNSAWSIKKNFATNITRSEIDDLYDFGIKNGALGGKLLGAGNGGFVLFFVPAERRSDFLAALDSNLRCYTAVSPDLSGLTTAILQQ